MFFLPVGLGFLDRFALGALPEAMKAERLFDFNKCE
ncbi:hypothetical protein SuNHUV7_40420 (plasmid) [Pseudoseohaeicola sp. NH-UV-7]